MDWLKKLNLPAPKTMQDVLNIAQQFTKNDPDGDQKADTFGIAFSKTLWGSPGLEGFFNAYHAYPNVWIKKNDSLEYGGVQPEDKTALEQLQKMYADGEIDPEFGVKDSTKVNESLDKIGVVFGLHWLPLAPLQAFKDKDPNVDWQAFPIPSIDATPAAAQTTFPTSVFYVVRKGVEHPEVAVKMLNLLLYTKTPENNTGDNNLYQKLDIAADGYTTWQFGLVEASEAKKNQLQQTLIKDALKTKDTSKLNAEYTDTYNKIVSFEQGNNSNWQWDRIFGPEGSSQSVLNTYIEQNTLMPDQYYGPATDTMTAKKSSLDQLELEDFTKIIMGDAPLSDFDKYLANWKSLGGDQITKEVNDWYVDKQKK